MNVEQLHDELSAITKAIHARGLDGHAHAHINWFGDEFLIEVGANEPFDANGHWTAAQSFSGKPSEATDLISRAHAWAGAIPSEEDRACELIIRKLTEFADKLPEGNSEIAQAAFVEIHKMLIAKAERLSKNGLPSPNRVNKLEAV